MDEKRFLKQIVSAAALTWPESADGQVAHRPVIMLACLCVDAPASYRQTKT